MASGPSRKHDPIRRLAGITALVLLFLLALLPLLARIVAPPPMNAGRPDVAFVGDSLTAGGDWEQAFPKLAVVNLGVSGDTSRDVLARLPALRAAGARSYLVMVGINDIRRGLPTGAIAARIHHLRLALGASPGTRVLIQSTLPCEAIRCGRAAVDAVDELNRRLRRQTPAADFIDLSEAFQDEGGLRPAYSSDGLHLNPAGYRRWQHLLAPLLEELRPGGSAGTSPSV